MEDMKLMKWLRQNCLTSLRVYHNKFDYYWCITKEANDSWDYIEDDRLKWYTDEEMFEIYKKSNL